MSKNSIKLSRVGGLSYVRQKGNKSAPEKYGLYAFIWPYLEEFYLGSTNHRGIIDPNKPSKSRYDELKSRGLKNFLYEGYLYCKFDIPNKSIEKNEYWLSVHSYDLKEFLLKYHVEEIAGVWEFNGFQDLSRRQSMKYFSKDIFEVFVPRGGKII